LSLWQGMLGSSRIGPRRVERNASWDAGCSGLRPCQ
jgi:hypothetical protein